MGVFWGGFGTGGFHVLWPKYSWHVLAKSGPASLKVADVSAFVNLLKGWTER
jgi:hypothetical protein